MIAFVKKYKFEFLIFFVAVFTRAILFFINFEHNDRLLIPTIKGDDGYFELSRGLLAGHGFSWDETEPFSPNPLRPPVYPMFIAGILYIFGSYWAVLLIQALVGSLVPVLGMRLADILFSSRAISITVGFLLALEPYAVLLSVIFYTETLFTFLFFLALLFFLRYMQVPSVRSVVWSGVFLGLATLVKPTIQYVPLVIPFFMAWRFWRSAPKKVLVHIGIFLGVFMLVITPWIYRNYAEFGVPGMSAQPAYNLYVYLAPSVLAIEKGIGFATAQELFFSKEGGIPESSITLATADYFTERATAVFFEYPASLARSFFVTLITFFTHDGMLTVLQYAGQKPAFYLSHPALFMLFNDFQGLFQAMQEMVVDPIGLVLLGRFAWVIITGFFFFGVWRLMKTGTMTPSIAFILFLVAYFAVTTAINGLGVNARFRIPVNVFIFSVAVYGCIEAGRYVWKKIS